MEHLAEAPQVAPKRLLKLGQPIERRMVPKRLRLFFCRMVEKHLRLSWIHINHFRDLLTLKLIL